MRAQGNQGPIKLFERILPVVQGIMSGRRRLPPVALPPDLSLLFQAQARGAGFRERIIQHVLGYYRIAPTLTLEQLHQLAFCFEDEFDEGRRHA